MIPVPTKSLLQHAKTSAGAVVLITGGASGFGRGVADILAANGAHVFIIDRNDKTMATAVAAIKALGGSCASYNADVTDDVSLNAAFDACEAEFGRAPDIVYANAGVAAEDHYEKDSGGQDPRPPRDITLKVNLRGMLATSAVAQQRWARNASGGEKTRRLVLSASMGGISGMPGATFYSSSKHATIGYWKALCDELATGALSGFECHVVCPFFSKTPILKPEVLFVIAGIPAVSIEKVAQTLVYAGTGGPPAAGGALLLPDDEDPALVTVDEYDPFSPELGAAMEQRVASESDWRLVGPWTRWWRDVSSQMFKRAT